jgi:hypothetical protein
MLQKYESSMYTEILLSRPVLGTIPNNVVTVSIPYVIWASEGTTRSLSVAVIVLINVPTALFSGTAIKVYETIFLNIFWVSPFVEL